MTPTHLLSRLDAIGRSLERRGDALALIGLGSVGLERERLDEHSDLDFFVIVDPDAGADVKGHYLRELDWLGAVHPLVFSFQNTPDGHKALFADGIFCEFAIFEPDELDGIPFAPGRLVWKRQDADESLAVPRRPLPAPHQDERWLIGEVLSNLFVGLGRDARGERLAALRLIQGHAVDHLLALIEMRWPPEDAKRDPFSVVRRFEARHPRLAERLAEWTRGYGRNRASALSILDFLEEHFDVPAAMASAIRGAG